MSFRTTIAAHFYRASLRRARAAARLGAPRRLATFSDLSLYDEAALEGMRRARNAYQAAARWARRGRLGEGRPARAAAKALEAHFLLFNGTAQWEKRERRMLAEFGFSAAQAAAVARMAARRLASAHDNIHAAELLQRYKAS